MGELLFKEEKKEGAFTVDFSKINRCKGLVYLEVKPVERVETLILNNKPVDLISGKKPFILEANIPITSGELVFEPFKDSPRKMVSIVRMLLIKE